MNAEQQPILKDKNLSPESYVAAARQAREQGQLILAHTMLRCACTLGADVSRGELAETLLTADQLLGQAQTYQRNMRVVDLIEAHFGANPISVVDVGGNDGIFSHMIPEKQYFLCEPSVNNMLPHELVASGRIFDVCVSIHVFEHIPDEDKHAFFATLVKLARRGIVLCNPTDTGTAVQRQKFLLEVFGPWNWILEHLECGTPTMPLFEELAAAHDLELHTYPSGNVFLSIAVLAMEHFSGATCDPAMLDKCQKLVRYINEHRYLQDSAECPRDYAFVFVKRH